MSDNAPPPKTTDATTGISNMPSLLPEIPQGGGILAACASVVAAVFYLRRKISRDGLEVTKDGAEGAMLETAIAERDKAMATAAEAWKVRTEDAKLIGKLSSDVEHLTKANEKLTAEVGSLRDILYLFLPQSVVTMLQQPDGKIDAVKLRDAIQRQTGQRNVSPLTPMNLSQEENQ